MALKPKLNTVPLADKMISLALRDHLPDNHELFVLASILNDSIGPGKDIFEQLEARKNARMAYSSYLGIPFLENCS